MDLEVILKNKKRRENQFHSPTFNQINQIHNYFKINQLFFILIKINISLLKILIDQEAGNRFIK
jgi:hypothetical protein